MAQSPVIEEESGTRCGRVHPHNGYYAGNFSAIGTIVSGAPPRPLRSALDLQGATRTADAAPMTNSNEACEGWLI